MTKAEWRQWARSRSEQIDWEGAGARIRSGLQKLLSERRPAVVLIYLAMANEVDVEPLVAEQDHHTYLLTRTPSEGPLTVHPYGSRRERHSYGFEQPTPDSPVAEVTDIDIALVPGLAFDTKGARLGRGKGYFDELLGRLHEKMLIGVVPLELVVNELPVEAHDVPVTHLATEEGVKPVSSQTNP